ncbi:MAG: hypothetical protein IKW00_08875 [Clostridia bacterium]|nr:hypothetical protein [Clostridia bacterium]
MTIITVGGYTPPAPASLNVQFEDALLSVRHTLDGAAHVSRKGLKRRITVYWAYLEKDALSSLLSAVTENRHFPLSFPDPLTGEILEITAYSMDRRIHLQRVRSDDTPVWTGVEMTFMEC